MADLSPASVARLVADRDLARDEWDKAIADLKTLEDRVAIVDDYWENAVATWADAARQQTDLESTILRIRTLVFSFFLAPPTGIADATRLDPDPMLSTLSFNISSSSDSKSCRSSQQVCRSSPDSDYGTGDKDVDPHSLIDDDGGVSLPAAWYSVDLQSLGPRPGEGEDEDDEIYQTKTVPRSQAKRHNKIWRDMFGHSEEDSENDGMTSAPIFRRMPGWRTSD
ncbi:hypothetical protein GN958_ATG09305 [Phytophthora infestans]|uniref:Uncharacterized protein n=1 Tax=Phytophthora infestans TaxID=4787 RepID=A0A8S9UPQ7_PHYIN|nr:hypothetical protein GN958_ATG09305 [Phytophthora infestans]